MSCSWWISAAGLNADLTYIDNIMIYLSGLAALRPHYTASRQPLRGSASQGNTTRRGAASCSAPAMKTLKRLCDGNAYGQILTTYSTFSDYPAVS